MPVPLGGPDNADLRLVLLVGVGEATPDRPAARRRRVARATRDRTAVATTIAALDPDHGIEAFVVGVMLGSFGFSWRSAPPEHVPVGRVVLAGLPAPPTRSTARRSTGPSPSAAPAGAPGSSPPSRPTSRTPRGSPSRPSCSPPRPG